MRTIRSVVVLLAAALVESACEGPVGPRGPEGPQGPPGPQGQIALYSREGTIYNHHYTTGNPYWASIPLASSGPEPTVLFIGIEKANGVFNTEEKSSVIYGGTNSEFTVPGTRGWYALVRDSDKSLVTRKYLVEFVQWARSSPN